MSGQVQAARPLAGGQPWQVTRSTLAALDAMRAGAPAAARVFGLRADTIARRVKAAARAAGLGSDFSGHSGRGA